MRRLPCAFGSEHYLPLPRCVVSSNGDDKGAALRQAKVDLLKEFSDQTLPIYWAGFTLVGDGYSANNIKTKT